MSTLVGTPLNPVTLAFADRALEQEFRAGGDTQPLAFLRLSLGAALVLCAGLGLLDRALLPESHRCVWFLRYALVCPILAGLLLLSFAPFFRRWQGFIMWAGAGGVGVGLVLMVVAARSSESGLYVGCLCLHLVCCCLLPGVRIPAAAVLCLALGAIYGLMGFTTPAGVALLGDGTLLLAAAILGLAAGHGRERSRRADFLQQRMLDRRADEVRRVRQEAEGSRQELETMARVDALTGLASRPHFFETAERDLERCRRYAHPLAVLMLDLDHFRVVNDTCGHVTGDQVLQAVAGQIRYNVREADMAGRWGGEEFVVVLPETDREAALQVGERLRGFVESLRIDTLIGRLSVTVSVGIATAAVAEADSLDDLLSRADKALLAAKQAGRNRVMVWDGGGGVPEIDRS